MTTYDKVWLEDYWMITMDGEQLFTIDSYRGENDSLVNLVVNALNEYNEKGDDCDSRNGNEENI